MADADKPQHLNVWLCPHCAEPVELIPPARHPQPGEYELQLGWENYSNDWTTRGVYITEADALACMARHVDLLALRAEEADTARSDRKAQKRDRRNWEAERNAFFGGATLPADWSDKGPSNG